MGYAHIENLYKNQTILLFRECYALEKIHGTSAHVALDEFGLRFFSGGEKHDRFSALFDAATLQAKMAEIAPKITVYGEAYGGKMQGMKGTYGADLRFVVFDVLIGDTWLAVPDAADVAAKLGMEFVHYERIPTDLTAIDAQRDADSAQAVRNGIGPGRKREGVVLRPLREVFLSNGDRVIAKHKRDDFAEVRTPRPVVDPEKMRVLEGAEAIAQEWVTPMRLAHVLDKMPDATGPEATRRVIDAVVEDVLREATGEIVKSKDAIREISKRAAAEFHAYLKRRLSEAA